MPWFNLNFTDFIKKRVCKFLLNRYLGQFFAEKLSVDQICLDLYNGKGSVFNVELSCEAINSIFELQGWDFEVTSGSIGSVSVGIPWNKLMAEDSHVEVEDLYLCLRPHARSKDNSDDTTMLESMWDSMSSSMQLAQECLERNEEEDASDLNDPSNMDGLEKFAQTIDNILNRIKVKLVNTTIRIEHLPKDSDCGVALIVKIKKFDYQNEASGGDTSAKSDVETDAKILVSTHATHHISFDDITFFTEEFRIAEEEPANKRKKKSRSDSARSSDELETTFNSTISNDPYLSAISSFSPDNEMFYNESSSLNDDDESDDESDADEDKDDESDSEDNIFRNEMVMIGRLNSRQEIRINMKMAENIEGPKVTLQMAVGALTLFMTPRQMHMLLLLCDILLNGDAASSSTTNKDSFEKEMSQQQQPTQKQDEKRRFGGGLSSLQTWAGDEYDCNSEYSLRDMHMINKLRPVESDSLFSSNSSSMTSSMCSSASQNTSRRRRAIERDQNADISHFNIRIAGIYMVILHDDLLVASAKDYPLNESSVEKLSSKCNYFFTNVLDSLSTVGTSDLMKIGTILKKACDNNHLRFMLAPIILDGEERRTTKGNCTKLNISISRADIHEILGDMTLPILDFYRKDSTQVLADKPEVQMNMEKTFYVMKSSSGRQFVAPRLNFCVTLSSSKLDFDITIFDRLHALFSSPFAQFAAETSFEQDYIDELSPSSQKIVQPKSKIKIQSSCFNLVVRFPIVDLRPLHDPDKVPWWQRHVRQDFLLLKFIDFQVNFISPSTYDIIAHDISVFYHETEKSQPIILAKALPFENVSKYYTSSPDYPRIVIQVPNDVQLQEMNENFLREQNDGRAEDTDSDPTAETIKTHFAKEKESTPFSTKKVCRESDTPHSKMDDGEESETLLIPGDRDEMNKFCDSEMKFSRMQIKLDIPVVSVQLKSKHLYEVIYNRIVSDILMWESSVPKPKPVEVAPLALKNPQESSLMNAGMMDSLYVPFAMCKSTVNFESGSSNANSESESDNDQIFYSIHEKARQRKSLAAQKDNSNINSFQLLIRQGIITMYAPVRDAQNHVIPGQLGEFVLKVNSSSIFSVNGFHGNANLAYVCIQSENLEVYHCGLIPISLQNPPLRDNACSLPGWLKSTLYLTPKNSTLSDGRGSSKRDMLSLAVQIKASPEQGLKRVKISAGIQNSTLKYNSSLPEHFWLTQLMDMFDVKEDIIPGYTPYTNLTEFHLHLWDCAVDYRPLHYPYRAIATIGSFTISSNIATGAVGCTLRFVAEDVTLSLAPHSAAGEKSCDNKITPLPSNELICVGDLGLFEISLRLNEKVTSLSPKYDLRAAIKDFHIRTCADSGKALLELISYLASEGDLDDEKKEYNDAASETSSVMQQEEIEDDLLKTNPKPAPEVTQTQQQHVNSLMADAMEESIHVPSTSADADDDENFEIGKDVFFFPDEQVKREMKNPRKFDSYKRRYTSEDSISMDSSSYREDEEVFVRRYESRDEDAGSVNTELRELLDFEKSVMIGMKDEDFDPQVEMDLGDITKYGTPPRRAQPDTRKSSSGSEDDFFIVADEERPTYGDVQVQNDDPIRIIDNHFSAPHGKPDLLKAPADFPMAVQRYTLCEATLVWHMFGGYDFHNEDDKRKEKEERDEMSRRAFSNNYAMSDVYKMGVSYTKGSTTLNVGNSGAQPQAKLTWKTRGGYGRKHDFLMEIHLNKVRFSHETYPSTTEQASRQVLLITEVEIRDRLAISNINKFLYHPTVGFKTRQGNSHMVVIKALHLRPEPALKTQECCLRISLLPIRLNIDQDSLLFLMTFFNDLSGGNDLNDKAQNLTIAKTHQPPVMMVELPEAAQELQARKMVSENLTLLLNEEEEQKTPDASETANSEPTSETSPIFFRHVIFSPDVPIRLDYQGKRVELSHGPLAGLLMGLGQLQCSEIRLKKISYRHGILGVDKLINFLIQEWLQDIKKRQLPKILGGVGPMNSFIQLFQGIFDLFWLPIEQYQKDGRIVRGIQRGAQSFTARTALAALEITSRLIYLLQITAETAYDMVSPVGPSVRRRLNRKGKRKRIHPPQDIREGMSNAYHIVKDGIGDTAQTIMTMAALEADQKGYTGAVGAVVRQIPPTMVRPLVLATQATTNVLGGLKNELIPNARIEAKQKWKDDEDN